ncbi:MAG: hypothetical protein AUF67_00315 [Acidobacteria bacterium 13_1_20CM_58_21]|nr:MAG: hypothetical protein AUF67_00315 [Acidobacteria bacterium 13_1_20CM_58_21]
MSKKPEEERQAEAEDETGDDGEIESGVFASVDDVAGEAAETQWEFSAEIKYRANGQEQGAHNEERAAEFADRIHGKECRRNAVKK